MRSLDRMGRKKRRYLTGAEKVELLKRHFIVGLNFFTNKAQGVAICNRGVVIVFVYVITKQRPGVVIVTQ